MIANQAKDTSGQYADQKTSRRDTLRASLAALPSPSLPASPKVAQKLCADTCYGVPHHVADGVYVITADNAKDYTGPGTNTYIVGDDQLLIIDPGPACSRHLGAVLQAIDGRAVMGIFVTHTHMDHSPCAAALVRETGAPVYSGPALSTEILSATREEVDPKFRPDSILQHGQRFQVGGFTLKAVHTPGHFPNHFAYHLPAQDIVFSGDHVMGWSTTSVVPPLGDLADYLDSTRLLADLSPRIMLPSHGPAITDPAGRVAEIFAHRACRHMQIEQCLAAGVSAPHDIVDVIYDGLTPTLHQAALGQVQAHLNLSAEQANALKTYAPDVDLNSA